VRSLLQSTARAFPTSGGDTGEAGPLPMCTVPQYNGTTPVDQSQCYCTTAACGAGMLDAGAAVIAALGLQAHVAVSPFSPVAGQVVTLSAAPSVVASGRTIVAYRWEIVSGGGIVTSFTSAADGPTATAVASGAGTFSVRLTVTDNAGLVATTVNVVNVNSTLVGGVIAFDRLNFQGMWWDSPAGIESGWGINFAHQGDVIFGTWFTHDLNGKAWNLSLTAFQTGLNTFSGNLTLASGPPLGSVPFDPALVQRIPVGSATLTFADGNNGTFAYTVNGVSQSKPITRQVFGTLPTCVWGALNDLTLASNYTDMWWVPGGAESGWGINFAHEGDTIFATWFTYDYSGAALPMSATLTRIGSNVYSGTLIRSSGPPFNAVPFNPDAVIRTPVGTATVTFANGNAATFSYQVNDGMNTVAQTKAITRQVFRAPGTVCH